MTKKEKSALADKEEKRGILVHMEELAGFLRAQNLSEVSYRKGDEEFRLVAASARNTQSVLVSSEPALGAGGAFAPAQAPKESSPESSPGVGVTSPIVGTAYLAPEPGEPPYVQVGDNVEEGQTLLIVEAMKVMNAVPSPVAGRVVEISAEDGQPVEYGEVLLRIVS